MLLEALAFSLQFLTVFLAQLRSATLGLSLLSRPWPPRYLIAAGGRVRPLVFGLQPLIYLFPVGNVPLDLAIVVFVRLVLAHRQGPRKIGQRVHRRLKSTTVKRGLADR